jgi:Cu(I)/Ag(I) efflux system periplasmic protein CusF
MNASSKVLLRSLFIASSLALVTTASLAQTTPTAAPSTSSLAQDNYTLGEIKKIDINSKRLTIKHEAIKHLDMPGMTMVFQASEAKLLDGLNAKDRVTFLVESRAGAMVVTDIRRVKS